MALVLANRVQETTTTTGTGTITLAGAVSGFQSFAAIGNANTTYYTITSGTAWEVGIGTYTSAGTTLARTTILASSAAGAAITLAGTSAVFATYPAEKSVNQDGSFNAALGSAAAPSHSFVGDTNTGMFSPGADTIAFAEGGTEAMRIDASGNVGIGISSISAKLHVVGTQTIVQSTDAAYSLWKDGTPTKAWQYAIASGTNNSVFRHYDGAAWIEYMRITEAGNVGIGSNSPTNKLTVAGGIDFSASAFSGSGTGVWSPTTNELGLVTGGNTRVRIDSSGNVGIGVAAPNAKLDIAGTGIRSVLATATTVGSPLGSQIYLGDSNFSSTFALQGPGIGAVYSAATSVASDLTLYAYSGSTRTEYMRIINTGNVGIGTTAPTGKLHVLGDTSIFQGTGGSTLSVINGSGVRASSGLYLDTVVTTGGDIFFRPRTATAMTILATSGNVGIGVSPSYKLDVSGGDIRLTTNATYIRAVTSGGTNVRMLGINASDAAYVGPIDTGPTSTVFNASSSSTTAAFYTSGTEKMSINTSGTLSVGTAIAENSAGVYSFGTGELRVKNALENGTSQISIYNNNTTNDAEQFYVALNLSDVELGNRRSGALLLRTNNTERMRITSAGLVGIGTTSPDRSLTIGNAGVLGINNSGNTLQSTLQHAAGGLDIYAGGASYVAFGTNSSERMRITSTGNVLIGTTTTVGKLTVASATGSAGFNFGTSASPERANLYYDTDGTGWKFNIGKVQSAAFTSQMTFVDSGNIGIGNSTPGVKLDVTGGIRGQALDATGTPALFTTAGGAVLSYSGAGVGVLRAYSNGSGAAGVLTFNASGAENMRITTGGDVGIGTTGPVSRLHVNNASTAATFITGGNNNGGIQVGVRSDGVSIVAAYAGTGIIFGNNNSTTLVEFARFDSSGNLGIGTTTPARPLHVYYNSAVVGAYTMVLQGTVGGYGAGVSFQSQLTGGAVAEMARITADGESSWNTTAGTQDAGLRFYTALDGTVAEKMRLDASGNLGIGTTSPGALLQLNKASGAADLRLSVAGTLYGNIYASSSDVDIFAVTAIPLIFGTNNTERARISAAGGFSVGTTTDPGAGNILVPAGKSYFAYTSDYGMGTPDNNALQIFTGSGDNIRFGQRVSGTFTERMRMTSSGSFGIGTTNPLSTLDVNGAITTGRTAANQPIIVFNGDAVNAQQLQMRMTGTDAVIDATRSSGTQPNLIFQTDSAERMRINTSGNVGIGTTTIGVKLEVNGATRVVSGVAGGYYGFNYSTASVDSRSWSIYNDHTAYGDLNILTSSTQTGAPNTSRLYISAAGSVGIGTTSPGFKLSVVAGYADFAGLRIGGTAIDTLNNIYLASGDLSLSTGGGAITFKPSTTERARIDNSGNLLVGTTNPELGAGYTNIQAQGSSGAIMQVETTSAAQKMAMYVTASAGYVGTRSNHPAILITNNTERMRIATNGFVGVGTSTDNGIDKLTAAGIVGSVVSGRAGFHLYNGGATAEWFIGQPSASSHDLTFSKLISGSYTDYLAINTVGGITSASVADAVGYKGLPQNSQTASYTLALTDMGKHISITTGGVVIPANGSVAFPIGSAISIFNNSGSNQTISITTDTLRLAGTATTGSRTLAQYGVATCLKVTSTVWVISGAGVT